MRIDRTYLRSAVALALVLSSTAVAAQRSRGGGIRVSTSGTSSHAVRGPMCGPLDVVEVIDRSGSMGGLGIVNARNSGRYLISILDPVVDRIGLVSFASTPTVDSPLTSDFMLVDSLVAGLVAGGGTNIAAAIVAGHAELSAPVGRPIMVLITDGMSAELPMVTAAATARAAGIELVVIAYAGGISPHFLAVLQSMATSPAHFFLVNTTDDLEPLLDLLLQQVCACGDGIVVVPEVCDDGNSTPNDGCTACQIEPICGDGVVSPPEMCDDGSHCTDGTSCVADATCAGIGDNLCLPRADDLCSEICIAQVPLCGNGILEPFEECDDGNTTIGDGCDNCALELCGNGVLDPGEQCDDGNRLDGDGCSRFCTAECADTDFGLILDVAGTVTDGVAVNSDNCTSATQLEEWYCGPRCPCQTGGFCDTQARTALVDCVSFGYAGCVAGACVPAGGGPATPNCTFFCGNGIIEIGEACDDGNLDNGDGCNALCQPETACGNGIVELPEQCDDGNNIDGDGCTAFCLLEVCGDGILHPWEECDDGNIDPGDGCSPECTIETLCGDGTVDPHEECDVAPPTSQCTVDCILTRCGDAIVQMPNGDGLGGPANDGVEACDDGNLDPNDLCAYGCVLTTCGDTFLQAPNGTGTGGPANDGIEACDDGNLDPTDQCTSDCVLTSCGDGVVQMPNGTGVGGPANNGIEACDDGNTTSGDGCTNCVPDITFSVTWDYVRATCSDLGIVVEWSVLEEQSTFGYEVRAATSPAGPYATVSELIPATGPGSAYQHLLRGATSADRWFVVAEMCPSYPSCDASPKFALDPTCVATGCTPGRNECVAGSTCACVGGSRERAGVAAADCRCTPIDGE